VFQARDTQRQTTIMPLGSLCTDVERPAEFYDKLSVLATNYFLPNQIYYLVTTYILLFELNNNCLSLLALILNYMRNGLLIYGDKQPQQRIYK